MQIDPPIVVVGQGDSQTEVSSSEAAGLSLPWVAAFVVLTVLVVMFVAV
jgi:hypothetical protein